MKKIYLGLITSFKDIDKVINSFKFTINELSNHYEQITIINSENLKFFQSRSLSYNNIDFGNDLNKNIKFFNPQNVKEFNIFIKDKEIVLINSLGQTFSEIKVHYLLNKKNIKQIMISNIGNIQGTNKPVFSRFLTYYFFKKIPYFLSLLFYGLGIFKKIEVRFVSNKDMYENFKNKKFSYVKKLEIINSKSYDIVKLRNFPIEENYIVFLNPDINHPEWIEKRGKIDSYNEKKIYKVFKDFLNYLYYYYNKEIVVCVHPLNNLVRITNLLENFKVVQFQTPEYIRNAKLVVFADTSAIVDGLILKKNIICIKELILKDYKLNFVPAYHNIGLCEISLKENFNFDIKDLEQKIETSKKNYQIYNNRFSNPDGQEIGLNKIVKYINDINFDN